MKFLLDYNNYIIGIGDFKNTVEYKREVPTDFFDFINCYKLIDNTLIIDE